MHRSENSATAWRGLRQLPMDKGARRLLLGIGLVLACAVAWFIMGVFVFAFVAGDYVNPQDRPAGWVQALQRVLAGAWLFSPIVAILAVVALAVRRRRRLLRGLFE